MNINYRKYTESDEKQVLQMIEKLWEYVNDLDAEKWTHRMPGFAEYTLKKILADVQKNDGIIILALDGNQIAGFIVGTITKFTDEERLGIAVDSTGNITHLYLEETHRRSGIGQSLISKVEDYLKSKHCGRVSVGVFAPNIKARNFYKKCGFTERNINLMKNLESY